MIIINRELLFCKAENVLRYISVSIGNDNGSAFSENDNEDKNIASAMTDMLLKYKNFLIGIYGFLTLTLIAVLIILLTRLPASADNPVERKKALSQILICGLAIALMGVLGLVVSLAYNIFK